MPFKSDKQQRWMWANEPKIAREWTDRYGAREGGGIMDWAGQGGMKNFLGEQEMVSAPKFWKSAPDHEMTELAYITPRERDVLVDMDMYGTMQGGPNEGPSGLMSLNGWGSKDRHGNEVGMSGAATSAAEAGGGSGADRRELESYISKPDIDPSDISNEAEFGITKPTKTVLPQDIKDYRNAFIAAGGGQRVNPGFFDSRNTVSPAEIAAAKEYMNRKKFNVLTGKTELANPYAKKAFRKSRGGGIMSFLRGGGILGSIIRSLGQKAGFGKKWNEPTYDMSEFSGLGLEPNLNYSDIDNEIAPENEYYANLGMEDDITETETETEKQIGESTDRFIPPSYEEFGTSNLEKLFANPGINFGNPGGTDRPYDSGYNMDDAILQSNYEDIRGTGGDDITFAEYIENLNRNQPDTGGISSVDNSMWGGDLDPYRVNTNINNPFWRNPNDIAVDMNKFKPNLGVDTNFQLQAGPDGITYDDFDDQASLPGNNLRAEIKPNKLKQLKNLGIFKEGQKSDYGKEEIRMLVPGLENATDEELDQIISGTFTV